MCGAQWGFRAERTWAANQLLRASSPLALWTVGSGLQGGLRSGLFMDPGVAQKDLSSEEAGRGFPQPYASNMTAHEKTTEEERDQVSSPGSRQSHRYVRSVCLPKKLRFSAVFFLLAGIALRIRSGQPALNRDLLITCRVFFFLFDISS